MQNTTADRMRSLGFYQPFGELMLYDKTETRWVRDGKKPPFPLGRYLFYTAKKELEDEVMDEWCGHEIFHNEILATLPVLPPEKNHLLRGYAIATAELVEIFKLGPNDKKTFVKYVGTKTETIKGKEVTKVQWGLRFENVQAIVPFEWRFGKQGIGFVPDSELPKIIPSLTKIFRHGKENNEVLAIAG